MCGIMGYIVEKEDKEGRKLAKQMLPHLLRNSESRGREASGIAYHTGKGIKVIKQKGTTAELMESKPFKKFMDSDFCPALLIGHTRTPTNGSPDNNYNNHPLFSKEHGIAVVHNGSAGYDFEKKFEAYKLKREFEVDTEIILRVLEKHSEGKEDKAVEAIQRVGEVYGGSHTCAAIFGLTDQKLWLWKDTNPLHFGLYENVFFFASTLDILETSFAQLLRVFKWGLFSTPSEKENEVLYYTSTDDTIFEVSPMNITSFKLPEEESPIVKPVGRRSAGFNSSGRLPFVTGRTRFDGVPDKEYEDLDPDYIEYYSEPTLKKRLKVLKKETVLTVKEREEKESIKGELVLRERSRAKNRAIEIKDMNYCKTKRLKKRGKALVRVGSKRTGNEEKELEAIKTVLLSRNHRI